ncbi:MAG: hypothetical protein Ta2A_08560 [Treponemataceae bacterium]|nr:MAG: hypothetical protein Ta2A_08560 [Treponemataceae bacterium]
MTYPDFYVLGDKGIRGALNVSSISGISRTSDPYAILRHEFIPQSPIVWKRNTGSKPKDCISTSWAVLNLFSDSVFNLFEKCCFTGWDTYQCVVYGKNDELISGYKGLSVTGACGKLAGNLRRKEIRYNPAGKRYVIFTGLYFDLKTWDGCDFFTPKKSGYIFVTERVKEAVEKAKFTNIEFRNITTIESLV